MNQDAVQLLDPYRVLGIEQGAEDEQIRAAYLSKLKQFPPDRAPYEFEQVRDAYDLLRDRRRRARHTLFSVNPNAPLESLLEGSESVRRFVGPDPWLAVLKEKKEK